METVTVDQLLSPADRARFAFDCYSSASAAGKLSMFTPDGAARLASDMAAAPGAYGFDGADPASVAASVLSDVSAAWADVNVDEITSIGVETRGAMERDRRASVYRCSGLGSADVTRVEAAEQAGYPFEARAARERFYFG